MEMRRIACWVLGVSVAALLLTTSGVSGADIIHRYSFTADAKDSVGGADGTLMGNAMILGGQVALDGPAGTYVDLSAVGNDIGNLTNATFEAWATPNVIQNWARIFDFGQDTTNNMFLTASNGSNGVPRFAITTNGYFFEQQVQVVPALQPGVEMHIAVTIDNVNQVASIYLNGQIAAAVYNYTNTPNLLGATANNYLGKSQYNDPYFNGSINEFRIYNVALSAAQIATSFANGPDGTPP